MGVSSALSGGLSNQSGSGTSSGTQSSTPVFSGQAQSFINRLASYQPEDLSNKTAASSTAIQANTRNQLPGIISQARSKGYGKAANWGEGNIASAATNALGQRDVQLAGLNAQAAQQGIQNQQANNQTLASVLSLMRGQTGTSTGSMSQSQKGWNAGGSLAGEFKI